MYSRLLLILICFTTKVQLKSSEIGTKYRISPSNIEEKPKKFLASKYKKYDRSQILLGILLENYSSFESEVKFIANNPILKPKYVKPFSSKFAVIEEFKYRENLIGSILWRLDGAEVFISYEIPYRR